MNNKAILALLIFMIVLGLSGNVFAEDKKENSVTLDTTVGYTGYSGSKNLVGVYGPFEDKIGIGASLSADLSKVKLELGGFWQGSKDQKYYIDGDISRILRIEGVYDRFPHRFIHDPLLADVPRTPIGGVTPSAVKFTDNASGKDYYYTRTETNVNTKLSLPFLPWVKFKLGYRELDKEGYKQTQILEFCTSSTCHINSYSREIKQKTKDLTLGAEVTVGPLAVSYTHLQRKFDENGDTLTHKYNIPSSYIPGSFKFTGTQEVALVPDAEMSIDTLKAKIDLPLRSNIYGSYSWGKRENEHNKKDVDFKTANIRLTSSPVDPLTMTGKYMKQDIDNNVSGAVSRDITQIGGDAAYRLWKGTTLRLGYEWENTDRDNYHEAESTGTRTLKASVQSKIVKGLDGSLRYKFKDTDNPAFHSTPEKTNDIFAGVIYTPISRLSFNTSYQYIKDKNDDSKHEDRTGTFIIGTWFAPIEKLNVSLSYTYRDNKITDTMQYGFGISAVDVPYVFKDYDAPYTEKANTYMIAMDVPVNKKLSLSADLSYTSTKASFDTGDFNNIYNPKTKLYDTGTDIGESTKVEVNYIDIGCGAEYQIAKNTMLSAKYTYRKYDDRINNDNDGREHLVFLTLGQKF